MSMPTRTSEVTTGLPKDNSQLQSKHPNSNRAANVARYKTLPSDWKTKDHYYFYGWAVTKEILQRYLSSINRAHAFHDDDIGIASSAIFYMQQDVGFHHINYVAGKVDNEAAVNCRVEQTEEGSVLNVMSIGCTRSKRLFWRRPTTKQLKRLVEIFGEEPRWFEDFYTKEEFEPELMH